MTPHRKLINTATSAGALAFAGVACIVAAVAILAGPAWALIPVGATLGYAGYVKDLHDERRTRRTR